MNIYLFLFVVLKNITILDLKKQKNVLICELTNSWSRKQSHHILAVRSLSGAFDHKTFIFFWTLSRTFHPTDMFLLEPVRITVINNKEIDIEKFLVSKLSAVCFITVLFDIISRFLTWAFPFFASLCFHYVYV